MTIIDLADRLRRPLTMRAPIEVTEYQPAAIRMDVCPVTLAHALATHGLTFSNHTTWGLVIHPIPPEVA